MNHRYHPAGATARHPAEVPAGRLWTGVLLAPAAWITHGALGWYFGYSACAGLTSDGARAALALLFVIALVLALAGGSIAWSNWGRTTSERHVTEVRAWDRVEYMSAGGVLISGIFVIAIIWNGLIPLMVVHCGGMR